MIKIMGNAGFHRMKRSSTMSKLNPRRLMGLAALTASGILLAAALIASAAETGKPAAMAAGSELPEGKRTTLGLYVTAGKPHRTR
jgi:nitrous oxide reductase